MIFNVNLLFLRNKFKKRKNLITFFTAGYPLKKSILYMLKNLNNFGSDIIEIGIPFSDPIAEGLIIQKSSIKSLKQNISILMILNYIYQFRKINNIPLILMGYINNFLSIKFKILIKLLIHSKINGLIIVDLPPEEFIKFNKYLKKNNNINIIFLLTPTSRTRRINYILSKSKIFIYYVSLNGLTGSDKIFINDIMKNIEKIKLYTNLPIGIGFGINNYLIIKKINKIVNTIIIGSRIIQEILISKSNNNYKYINLLLKNIRHTIN